METNCRKQCYFTKPHDPFSNACAWGGKARKELLIVRDKWLDTSGAKTKDEVFIGFPGELLHASDEYVSSQFYILKILNKNARNTL